MKTSRRSFLLAASCSAISLNTIGINSSLFAASLNNTDLKWLDGEKPNNFNGTSFGIPFPKGSLNSKSKLKIISKSGEIASQTWPIAYWPDKSVKWLAVATEAADSPQETYSLVEGVAAAPKNPIIITETSEDIQIKSGKIIWTVPKSGSAIIKSAKIDANEVVSNVELIALSQSNPSIDESDTSEVKRFKSKIETVVIEQNGQVRSVIKITGKHASEQKSWLPFSLRLYFYAGAKNVRVMHSFIYDGDETKDFIRGIGLNLNIPLKDELYNRHIRIAGADNGIFAESVRPLTGLRRDPGKAFKDAQIKGKAVPALTSMSPAVRNTLQYIPTWGDYKLSQLSSDGFTITKRTEKGHPWIDASASTKSNGFAYVGGSMGGAAISMTDFWQRCPSALDIRNAATDKASLTAWMWSPDAEPMDLRPYRPSMGVDTTQEEIETLNITYEDYEIGWGRAYGIARTTEFNIWALEATADNSEFAKMANSASKAPRLIVSPERIKLANVFGAWSLPDKSGPIKAKIENRLDYQLDFYINQQKQHKWYGFWNYGDVMHTYDEDRHMWRYDIGGYAWANSELSPDLWLWYSYLRTGRADVFRFAEAMTRQTGEVDIYHIGPWKGFGTRHGVQPFADSSKQPRVSNAAYRRIYYYLTADERVGDLMRDLNDSDYTLKNVNISRKLANQAPKNPDPNIVDCGFGTSWGSFISAWLTEWERTGDIKWRDRILNGMQSIAKLKNGWFVGGTQYDLRTGKFLGTGDSVAISHLNCVFGVFEIQSELFDLLDANKIKDYKKVWLDYCKYYNASAAEIDAFLGVKTRGRNLIEAHSRLTAYAAKELKDEKLAERAVFEFIKGDGRFATNLSPTIKKINQPAVINNLDEDASISTNGASQWGLAAIANLALLGDSIEKYGAKYAN